MNPETLYALKPLTLSRLAHGLPSEALRVAMLFDGHRRLWEVLRDSCLSGRMTMSVVGRLSSLGVIGEIGGAWDLAAQQLAPIGALSAGEVTGALFQEAGEPGVIDVLEAPEPDETCEGSSVPAVLEAPEPDEVCEAPSVPDVLDVPEAPEAMEAPGVVEVPAAAAPAPAEPDTSWSELANTVRMDAAQLAQAGLWPVGAFGEASFPAPLPGFVPVTAREPVPGRARPEGARPEGARPEGARPEGARPEGARPEEGCTAAAEPAAAPVRLSGAVNTMADFDEHDERFFASYEPEGEQVDTFWDLEDSPSKRLRARRRAKKLQSGSWVRQLFSLW